MAKRGRPRYPDILTPREWEVLALLREGLSNEGIAERLDITERTAKYHVSEILGKLGVTSREEAAAWQPEERRPWWLATAAPVAFFWRKVSFGWLSPATTAVLGVVVATGLGLLVWGLVRTGGDGGAEARPRSALVAPTDTPAAPPEELMWEGFEDVVSVHAGTCGDAPTADAYGVPMMLRIPQSRGLMTFEETILLGLEAEPYEYVPAQVSARQDSDSPEGWELSQKVFAAAGGHPNRFSTRELFLRRLDQPSLLFRYDAGFCSQADGLSRVLPWRPGLVENLPSNPPEIIVRQGGDHLAAQEVIASVERAVRPEMQVVRAELQITDEWAVLLAGDGMGPARRGHVYGYEIRVEAATGRFSGERCCYDFSITAP